MVNNFRSKKILLLLPALFLIVFAIYANGNRFRPLNPNKDTALEDREAGIAYCVIYKGGEFYGLTSSDAVFSDMRYDLRSYVKNFYNKDFGQKNLCGFTFKSDFKKISENTYEFTGQYYGISDEIKISATKINNNSIRVSIKNKSGQNIDDKLRLNGPISKLVDKLPIEEELYSIRYLQDDTTIIVTFYKGFSLETIGTVESTLQNIMESEPAKYSSKIRYFVNAVGEFELSYIKSNVQALNK